MTEKDRYTRRKLLGVAGSAAAVGLAGCLSGGDDGGNSGNGNGSSGSNGGGESLSGKISISGSSTVYPLCVAISEQFQKKHGGVSINVARTGSGGGFKNHFCPGNTQFNNSSRHITESEKKNCRENGVTPIELRVATDALTVIVNNDADWIDCITVDQLKQIWEPGGAKKWSDVDSSWPDKKLELYGAASTSGTFDYFTETITGESGKHRQDYQATERDANIIQGVSGSKNAIGYLGFSYYYQNPDQVKALKVKNPETGECVKPSLETAKDGSYSPLARPLFTYPAKSALKKKVVREFARFYVKQSTNKKLVSDTVGYVPNTKETMQKQLDKLNKNIKEVTSQ